MNSKTAAPHSHAPLLRLVKQYFEQDPLAAAHTMETMGSDDAAEVLKYLPSAMAAKTLVLLNDAFAAVLLEKVPESTFRKIGNRLDSQKATSILLRFSVEMRRKFLDLLDEKQKREIQELLNYPEDSAGRIMSINFIAFHGDTKVRDAVDKIRKLARRGTALSYIYVIDTEGHLTGIMNMRDMLLAESGVPLERVMRRDVFSVNYLDQVEKVANALSDHRYFVAPVVDNDNRLLGVVRAEQLIGDVQDAVSEDIQKMVGVGGDERAFSPLSQSLKTRLPWLHVNLATAFLAAAVVSLFEDIIAKLTVLAIYLPVVAGQGGNAGAQSLAIVMRGLVMREIPPHKAKKLILKETLIGIINGVVIGIVTGLIAWLWQGNPVLGIVIGLGMVVNLTVAGLSGAVIPLAMKAMHLDPAQCSSIILTTITDVMGFFAFLGFAVLFRNFLI
ncbi:MAG: magnesium transporter [Nitrospiraceae bacterium]|nr:MAG: magnesium transporter [Nitrospiraceae bacterium]